MSLGDKHALWWLVAGFGIWSLAFVLLYALQALGCAQGWQQHRLILLAASIICMVPLVFLSLWRRATRGEPETTLARAGLWANQAALAAGVLVLVVPTSFVSLCT